MKFLFSIFIFILSLLYFYSETLGYRELYVIEEMIEIAETHNADFIIFYPLKDYTAAIPHLDLHKKNLLFIQEEVKSIPVQYLKNKKVVIIEKKDMQKPLAEWNRTLLDKKWNRQISTLHLPRKTLIESIPELSVITIWPNKTEKGRKRGKKISYGQHKSWEEIDLRTVSINKRNTQCVWIHPSDTYTISLRWKNEMGSQVNIYLAGADSRELNSNLLVIFNIYDEQQSIIATKTENISTKELGNFKSFSFDIAPDQSIELKIAALSPGKHHYCLMGDIL